MKAFFSILVMLFLFGNVSFAFAENNIEYEGDLDQAMIRYSELKLDVASIKNPNQLHDKILECLKEIDFFVKKYRGENAMVQISYYSFPEEFWKEMRKIVKERKQLRMYYFRYIKDQEEGIDDIYVFWAY